MQGPKQDRVFKIATICADDDLRKFLNNCLNGRSASYEVLPPIRHYVWEDTDKVLLESLRRNVPDICLIDFDQNSDRARRTVQYVRDLAPGATVFAAATDSGPDAIVSAMRAGCAEYLLKPLTAERVSHALSEFEKARRDHSKSSKMATLVAMLGVKGGVGVTSLAVHLGAFAAEMGSARTLLIDHHPHLGDVSVCLDLKAKSQYHFYELVNNLHRLDEQLVKGFVARHATGLEVLTSPEILGDQKPVSPSSVEGTLRHLATLHDLILVDCAPGLSPLNMAVVENADRVYLVATPELASVRNLSRYLEHLGAYNFPDDKLHVVINRYSKKGPILQQQIEKAIHRPVSLLIPNSYADVVQAINTGTPISPHDRSELAAALVDWTKRLTGRSADQPKSQKRRFGILGL